ncbi:PH domain-containing protein [Mycobacterium sp. SMC-4]|uniref:PH domain-containing protein n=1 Tax=Mycobacterium sp. SMC-4 TaxID=2857059 RepID=UPI003D0024D2
MAEPTVDAPIVIKISQMAHLMPLFLALALMSVVMATASWTAVLLVVPVLLSVAIVRYRTVADRETITARTMLGSQTLRWEDIDGLRFGKPLWAMARRRDGSEVMLPAVTFNTLPSLTLASGGRVPNPYV